NKCLDVKGNEQVNGTHVQVYDCNGTGAQRWKMSTWSGSTKIQLDGTNYCLDAGSPIGNNVGLKIWQCYDGLPQQQFYITGDHRIAVEGKGQCLDQPNGNDAAGTQTQTYQCTTGNTNQVWTVGFYYV
ncbi:carbohydrate-binding module family 13 protein, partial [Flagelloscypha sp. PMI_526]